MGRSLLLAVRHMPLLRSMPRRLAPFPCRRSGPAPRLVRSGVGAGQDMCAVARSQLIGEMPAQAADAETAQIEIEIAVDWYQVADIDAGGGAALMQPVRCPEAGR